MQQVENPMVRKPVIVELVETDVFGDPLMGTVWTFPGPESDDQVVSGNLEMYLEIYLGAKKATVLKRGEEGFYESKAWTFPDDGYTVEESDLEQYLEWAYGAQKEYL